MSSYSEGNDFDSIMDRLLSNVSNDLDKRQGSIIYDALAPAAAELAQCYIALDVFSDQTYLENAVGENLDLRVADYGVIRETAKPAIRIGNIYDVNNQLMDIEIGSRFSIPNEYGGYNFKITEKISIGAYLFTCETNGIAGNDYLGELLPLMTINNLGRAELTGIQTPGEDEETDEQLRERTKDIINQKSFSGNKASYLEYMDSQQGVGLSKVFPFWNGGGTVKIAFITSDFKIPSAEFVNQIQTQVDPIQNSGEGIGIAPIGHSVTIAAPTKFDINVQAKLTMKSGYTAAQVQSKVEKAINDYLEEVQKEWEDNNTLYIFHSRIIASILTVDEVNNATSVSLNGGTADLEIEITSENVLFPMLNEVVLNES